MSFFHKHFFSKISRSTVGTSTKDLASRKHVTCARPKIIFTKLDALSVGLPLLLEKGSLSLFIVNLILLSIFIIH